MDLQHVNAKLLVQNPEGADLEPVISVFHGWIQDSACEEILLDVADYRHVQGGPGVVLIGHEANYSLDIADNQLGIRYNRKAALNGSSQDRLEQATRAVLRACLLLENDSRLEGKIRFNGRDMKWFVNDRLIAPNLDATREALEPGIRTLCARLFANREYSLHYASDPRRLFSVAARTSEVFTPDALLKNLLS
jgi:hypothetical protein